MNGIKLLDAILLHFLWQGMLIAVAYAGARRCTSRPNVRYALACAALTAMAASPVATWIVLRPVPPDTTVVATSSQVPHAAVTGAGFRSSLPRFLTAGYDRVSPVWLSWVAAAWMVGAGFLWLRLLGGWMIAERLRRRQVRPAPPHWQQVLDGLRARLRVSMPVQLLVSGLARAPAVVGLLRPVVLVPAGALAGLPAEQMEALLLHELAHIRRYDYLVNALQNMVEALLFYHPAVWWVSGHMRSERELCCDDLAVAVTGDARSYALALVEVGAAAHHRHYRGAVAASGGSLASRVARLLGEPLPASHPHASASVVAAVLVAITVTVLIGQSAPPQFEVASIKPGASGGGSMIRPLPGRLTANAPLRTLVQGAYGLQPFQIVGGPDWTGSERYEVDARASGKPGDAEMFFMLQSLLQDRFQLRVHRESREMPIYALMPVRGGLHLPPAHDGRCVEETELLGPLADPGARMQVPSQSVESAARCGRLDVTLRAEGARLRGSKVSMAEFVRVLSRMLGRLVTDRTGFSGQFDVELDFLPDDTTLALPPPPPGAIPDLNQSPPIFSAVQQLGLKLESTREPVEVLVIDQAQRPPAN